MAQTEILMHKARPCIHSDRFRTSVVLIGAGGTGSHVLHGLAMMHMALVQLGHCGLSVLVYDDDVVATHNVGRQRFSWGDVGTNKATALITRINRQHGLDWQAAIKKYEPRKEGRLGNIVITAVDNGATRNLVHDNFRKALAANGVREIQEEHMATIETHYWLDLGNDDKYGQAVLAAEDLPTCVELFGRYSEEPVRDSCSAEESLRSQDLYINQAVATAGLSLLWDLFRRAKLERNVVYVNLKNHTTRSTFKPLNHADKDQGKRTARTRRKMRTAHPA